MNRNEAKELLRQQEPIFLERAKRNANGQLSYICPICRHGKGGDGVALDPTAKGHKRYKCFNCQASEDVIGWWKHHKEYVDDSKKANYEIFNELYEYFGITIDDKRIDDGWREHTQNHPVKSEPAAVERENNQNKDGTSAKNASTEATFEDLRDEKTIDFTAEVLKAHEALMNNPDALKHYTDRGLSPEIIEKYKIGYAPLGYNHLLKAHPGNQCKSPKNNLYKYVLPYLDADGKYHYILTEINNRNQIDDYNGKYRKMSIGETGLKTQIFNERYLKMDNPPEVVFVCEGFYDALSIEQCGGNAIAFIGVGQRRFLDLCNTYKPKTTFVIALDNDNAGQSGNKRVTDGLDHLRYAYILSGAPEGKDFNEALVADAESLAKYVSDTVEQAKQACPMPNKEELAYMQQNSAAGHIPEFIRDIRLSVDKPFIPTGFNGLDVFFDGGLYSGLYFIGAISSLGKTTFVLQVADQIAQRGTDVMIFSLEMARNELMAKSVSRLTFIDCLEREVDCKDAKTTRGILTGKMYANYSPEEGELIKRSVERYREYSDRIFIFEGVGDIGVAKIADTVKKHIAITGRTPVVVIDYLQILAPLEDGLNDKQAVDKNVLELKRLSRDCDLSIIAISSFNRESYTAPVSMASFKESGAVEYSSDVLIGLQYEGMDLQDGEGEKERNKRVRELRSTMDQRGREGKSIPVQIKILKNRNGIKGDMSLYFYPKYNFFSENKYLDDLGAQKNAPGADPYDKFTTTTVTSGANDFANTAGQNPFA